MLVDISASMWIKKAPLQCWPLCSQQMSNQRWISGSHKRESRQGDPPWLWSPEQTSSEVQNRGINCPTKRYTYVLQKLKKNKELTCERYVSQNIRIFNSSIRMLCRSESSEALRFKLITIHQWQITVCITINVHQITSKNILAFFILYDRPIF